MGGILGEAFQYLVDSSRQSHYTSLCQYPTSQDRITILDFSVTSPSLSRTLDLVSNESASSWAAIE